MVFDNWGQAKTIRVRQEDNGVWVDLSANKKGIYLLKFLRQGKVVTKRVILNGSIVEISVKILNHAKHKVSLLTFLMLEKNGSTLKITLELKTYH